LGAAHIYYYWSEFSLPFHGGKINKKDVVRGIEESTLPTTLSVAQVNSVFTINLENFDFKAFGGSLYAYRLFARFAGDDSTL